MRKTSVETGFERGLFASRWLMAPFYVGLVGALAAGAGDEVALLPPVSGG